MIHKIYTQPEKQYSFINEYLFRVKQWQNNSMSEVAITTMLEF